MPQIDQFASIYVSQLFWLVVVFALIYFGIGRAMLPRIARTVDDRDARISGDLAAAEQARKQADAADDAYQAKLAESRAEAQSAAAAAKSQATAAAEVRLRAADAEIHQRVSHAEIALANARLSAVAQVELVATEVAQELVARVAGMTVERGRAAVAVADALAKA